MEIKLRTEKEGIRREGTKYE